MIVNERLADLPRNCIGPVFPTHDSEAMVRILGIRDSDRVLEIGGGFYPFARADVITDLSFSDASNRNGAQMLFRRDKTYVECPAEALPFRDGEFDFAFCSHVLEHTADPAKALREMTRVARRGYLEVPSAFSDYISGNPTHRWLITLEEGVLVLRPRNFMESPLRNFLHARIVNDPEFYELVHRRYRNLLNIQLAWEEDVPYRVVPDYAEESFRYEDPRQAGLSHLLFAYNLHHFEADPEYAVADAYESTRYLPDSADAWCILGLYNARMLLLDDAREAFRKALDLRPGDPVLQSNLRMVEEARKGGTFDPSQLVAPQVRAELPEAGETATETEAAAESLVSILFLAPSDPVLFDESFESLVSQRHTNREIIVLAGDPARARERVSRIRPACRVEIAPVESGSPVGARFNAGLPHCRGKYVAYLDRGQVWRVYHLPLLVELLEASGAGAAYSDALRRAYVLEPDGRRRYGWDEPCIHSPELRAGNLASDEPIPVSNLVHRRDVLDAAGGWDESLDRLAGRDLLLRVSRSFPVKHLRRITAEFRVRQETIPSPQEQERILSEQRRLIDNYSHFEPIELMRKLVELHNQNIDLMRQLEKSRSPS
jgi:ubiquinone/menaquinone biosynthesis C-methylase UbiE